MENLEFFGCRSRTHAGWLKQKNENKNFKKVGAPRGHRAIFSEKLFLSILSISPLPLPYP